MSVGVVGAVDRTVIVGASAPRPVAPGEAAPPSLLPAPVDVGGDAAATMMQIFADESDQDAKDAKADVERSQAEKALRRQQQAEALAAADAASKQKHGLFDAIGAGGVLGIATGNPVLLLADVTMHMTHTTPKILRELEAEHPKAIDRAAELYVLSGAASAAGIRAAAALAGEVVRDTGVLGKATSDRVGAALLLAGGGAGGAAAIAARKDDTVANDVRAAQKAADPYMKYVEYGAMGLAAASAIVASAGTATAPVVIVGVALSAAGTVSDETHALDHVVGAKAARYIDGGAVLAGAFVSGVGLAAASTQGTSVVARVLGYGADAVSGATKLEQGLTTMENATIAHEVDAGQIAATGYELDAAGITRAALDMLDRADAIQKDGATVRQIAEKVVATQCDTRDIAVTAFRG
jgi:hypothetical protein